MTAAQQPRLLDISRILSRAGRLFTGIDRVERAYLDRLLSIGDPLFGLARTRLGYLLLDRDGLDALHGRLSGREPWDTGGGSDGPVIGKSTFVRSRAEAQVRQHAIARGLPVQLASIIRRYLPSSIAYLNIGHTSLTRRVFGAVNTVPDARVTVFVHDTIPLDFPHFQKPGASEKFEKKMRIVAEHADLVVCGSEAGRADVVRHFSAWGNLPETMTAHLGAEVAPPIAAGLADIELSDAPYFIALGTIEPRKNHGFLLDLWRALEVQNRPEPMPNLLIIGSRGWNNDAVFRRLDALEPAGHVHELSALGDGVVAALMAGATALLAPSFSEGFGLPLLEAAVLGTPIVANDLPVYREYLGEIPVYADVNDQYLWDRTIRRLAEADPGQARRRDAQPKCFDLPTWDKHFNRVLKCT